MVDFGTGVLPKPTKLADLVSTLSGGIDRFLATGACLRRGNDVVHARGDGSLRVAVYPRGPPS